MKIRDIMHQPVEVAAPRDTLKAAAMKMLAGDCGSLPVGENDRLVGMVTDRDIVARGVAEGCNPNKTTVRDVMSTGVKYCYDDEDLDDLARNMATLQVKRLPVLNREKRLVGIVSLGDLAIRDEAQAEAGRALCGISQPNQGLPGGAARRKDTQVDHNPGGPVTS
jgi:CBS domain-containing protein